ncbi:MAG: type I-E CRISPR-associated endonuclease Cas1 [Planctomycetes bacterium]|nr:type I-E CRISPR-associated endonuclease Cas1 [Planctomycetota bacterium]
MRTLHDLPRFADRWSFLYLEMGRLDQDDSGLIFENEQGRVPVPIDQLSIVMLGPGTTVTHAAAKALSQNACLLAWTGQDGVRLYAHSTGATHSARRLIRQAALVSDMASREEVARRMYRFRFATKPPETTTIEQLRGMEGHRVRAAYAQYAARFAVPWTGRNYDPGNWDYSDPINRAVSTANACLNGVCHAAIVAAGYSAGLGFIHTGKMLSFVYDVADLYKVDLTVRVAFEVVARKAEPLERAVRTACREAFAEFRLMDRLLPDIQEVLGAGDDLGESADDPEGRVISLADRAQEWGFPREPDEPGEGEALGEGAAEM